MKYRKLGRYGLKVSEVALGGWLTQGRSLTDETTAGIVHKAIDLGINFFDTADVYNRGEAEKALAKAINGIKRENLVIGTKCFFPMSDNPNDSGLSRKHITESVHNSLKRLDTDYVDLMQFHRFDENVPLDETARAIDDLVRQGKVLYWGTSEWKANQIREIHSICDQKGYLLPASNQPRYSLLTRQIEPEVLPASVELGIGQVVFSPLAQGVLTGKYLPGQTPPEGSRGADETSNMFMGDMLKDEVLQKVQNLKKLVEDNGFELSQFALAWCLRQPGVSSVIVGATSKEQLTNNAGASGLEVPAELWARAEEICA